MWDEEDGFYYDVLRLPNGHAERLKVRSMVGLLPLCAATMFDGALVRKYPELGEQMQHFLNARPELRAAVHDPGKLGVSHQTGWTGVIARLMHVFATMTPEAILEGGKTGYFEKGVSR